ncbi:hypothetical protein BRDID11002_33940 [Bradyrhizobium diazoefficiens]
MNLKGRSLRALICGWKIVEIKWVAPRCRLIHFVFAYGLQAHKTHQGRLEDYGIVLGIMRHRTHLAIMALLHCIRALASLTPGPCPVEASGQGRCLRIGEGGRAIIPEGAEDALKILIGRRDPRFDLCRLIGSKGKPDGLSTGRDRHRMRLRTERKMQCATNEPLPHIHRNPSHIELKPRAIALHWTHHPIQHVAHRCYTVGRAQVTVGV